MHKPENDQKFWFRVIQEKTCRPTPRDSFCFFSSCYHSGVFQWLEISRLVHLQSAVISIYR